MFHIGTVLDIFRPDDKEIVSADSGVQATCRMWDEKIITVSVHRELQDKLKKKDIVLLDYRPMKNSPVPRMKIVKILSAKRGERALKNYSEFYSQNAGNSSVQIPFPKQQIS